MMIVKGFGGLPLHIESILVVQLGDIGDVVLSLPVFRALKENFSKAFLVVVVRTKAAGLVEDCPWIDEVIAVDARNISLREKIKNQAGFLRTLRKYRFDLALDLRTGTRGAIVCLLSGAPRRVGFFAEDGRLWRNRAFTDLWSPTPIPDQHMTERLLGLIRIFGVEIQSLQPEIRTSESCRRKAAILFENESIPANKKVIAVQPFSQWRYKEWAASKYVDLIVWLIDRHHVQVVIAGGPDEAARSQEIAVNVRRKHVHSLAGKTSIGILPAVLEKCSLFVGGDSAGIHIAAAVGTPTIGLFGPASSRVWAPRGDRHQVIDKGLPCIPCDLKGCGGRGISRCLEELTVDEVVAVVDRQLVAAY